MGNAEHMMAAMVRRASELSVDELKESVMKVCEAPDEDSWAVLSALLDALSAKMVSEEFVEFCETVV